MLNDVLKAMGMGIAFDHHRADFSRLIPVQGLHRLREAGRTCSRSASG